MAPNAPKGHHTQLPAVAVCPRNPFSLAISSFLSDIVRDEEVNSRFYKEVLYQLSSIALHDDSAQQNQQAAKALSSFIQQMDGHKRRSSKMIRLGEKLRPLVTGLSQFTTVADIAIQAGPGAAVIIYSGARLVLQASLLFIIQMCHLN
jgi:hypothetical protein